MWLCRQRWEQLGTRLAKVTKETADLHSDYFVLSQDGQAVLATFHNMEAVNLPFKLDLATDFVIQNLGSYAQTQLISDTVGADQNIARAWQRDHGEPVHSSEFNFPEKTALNSAELDFESRSSEQANRQARTSGSSLVSTTMAASSRGPLVTAARRPR